MKQYLELLNRVLAEGVREGRPYRYRYKSIFGHQMRFNLEEGFPLYDEEAASEVYHL